MDIEVTTLGRIALVTSLVALAGCACGDGTAGSEVERGVTIAPARLDFAETAVDSEKVRNLAVRNGGPEAIEVLVVVGGSQAFRLGAATARWGIPPGLSVEIPVVFQPATAGAAAAHADLSWGEGKAEVPLHGVGFDCGLESPGELALGDVVLGLSKTAVVEVRSIRNIPVRLEARASNASWSVTPTAQDLSPGGRAEFEVTFAPAIRGRSDATLDLSAGAGCTALVALSGRGRADSWEIEPESLDLGAVAPGSTRCGSLTVRNLGDLPGSVVEAYMLEGEASPFTMSTELPLPLDPESQRFIYACYSPHDLGSDAGTMRVVAGPTSLEVLLSGRGFAPQLAARPPSLDFGYLAPGGSVSGTVVLSSAPGPTEVAAVRIAGADQPAFSVAGGGGFRIEDVFPLEVSFTGGPVGVYEASLVVEPQAGDEPALNVWLKAIVVEPGSCDLRAVARMEFGMVPAWSSQQRYLTITNAAPLDCPVWGLSLEGSPAFQIVEGIVDGERIPSGGSRTVELRYLSDAAESATALLTLKTVDSAAPLLQVEIAGSRLPVDMFVGDDSLHFGTVPVDAVAVAAPVLELRSDGEAVVRATSARAGPSPFGLVGASEPLRLTPGAMRSPPVEFRPESPGPFEGELEIRVDGAPGPILLRLSGYALETPCGATCAVPSVICPGYLSSYLGDPVAIDAAGVTARGSVVSCTWSVTAAPQGSLAVAPVGCPGTFVPDLRGPYDLEVVIHDDVSSSEPCATRIDVETFSGVQVETTWSEPEDLDLHLFHPQAGDLEDAATWAAAPWDCFDGDEHPAWVLPSAVPIFLGDDMVGAPSEGIRLRRAGDGEYRIGLHWPGAGAAAGLVDAVTTIRCNGEVVATLASDGLQPFDAEHVATVTWSDGACTVTPIGTRIVLDR